MKHVSSDERIAAYLDQVCRYISWPPYAARVRRELIDHILTRSEYLQHERGFTDEEAVAQAIRLLGNPDEIGHALPRAYRPYRRLLCLLITCLLWAGIASCIIMILLYFPQ